MSGADRRSFRSIRVPAAGGILVVVVLLAWARGASTATPGARESMASDPVVAEHLVDGRPEAAAKIASEPSACAQAVDASSQLTASAGPEDRDLAIGRLVAGGQALMRSAVVTDRLRRDFEGIIPLGEELAREAAEGRGVDPRELTGPEQRALSRVCKAFDSICNRPTPRSRRGS